MKNRIFLTSLLLLVCISSFPNRRSRAIQKIDAYIAEVAEQENLKFSGDTIGDLYIFQNCSYDSVEKVYTYNYILIEDQYDINSIIPERFKENILEMLSEYKYSTFMTCLHNVGGSIVFNYTGDTSYKKLTINISYWDINGICPF